MLAQVRATIDRALDQLRATPDAMLDEPREVGRARLPSSVRGLLYHAGEHTSRHAGQADHHREDRPRARGGVIAKWFRG